MDHTRGLSATVNSEFESRASDCPDCGAATAGLPPVRTFSLGPVPLRRCHRCGCRRTCESTPRQVRICAGCRLPHLDETDHDSVPCSDCRSGEAALESPDALLAAATEGEVRRALAVSWELLGSAHVSSYLNRLLREVAGRIDGAPTDGQVVLVGQTAVRSLALPSGTVILSVGAMGALEDEAELAFVLGHELAHVGSGDASTALVRLSLRGLAERHDTTSDMAWTEAAQDLIRLGYGDPREHAADRAALHAVVELGYDPEAALRYLGRLRERTDRGDPDVAELALAHPPPALREQRVDTLRSLQFCGPAELRVDREVFRRAAGHSIMAGELVPVHPFDDPTSGTSLSGRLASSRRFWMLIGLLVLALVVVLALI